MLTKLITIHTLLALGYLLYEPTLYMLGTFLLSAVVMAFMFKLKAEVRREENKPTHN